MKIISWNIKWENKCENKNSNRIEENEKRVKVANNIIEDFRPDILSLLEAGLSECPEIRGYHKVMLDRKHMFRTYRNGIVLYINNEYKYEICKEVLKEFIDNKMACFLPVKIQKGKESFNSFFVWTTTRNGKEANEPYGYNRFNEILTSGKFKKTLEFIDGNKNDVIIIGDFNLVSNHRDENKQKKWLEIKSGFETIGLQWVENNISTYYKVINDHCFISDRLRKKLILEVGDNKIGNIISDHNIINVQIQNKILQP
ncbi:hypothetical protein P6709_02085 [Jeotgalibacillus sp. ET6]|uniref:endonuclease/exonuclease/phosphatase family protein n=1 Tax=Jeotgalibacillus sp. ET6 TaxID=3037260 RepID=UPI0024186813|nr:endonuclease/exonuclease/phosphatase family protein [Jeotgalibacillus sp. ET6]MDG5470520.1 hypothetical protein [Jeotgalibacillus sp. ET6]